MIAGSGALAGLAVDPGRLNPVGHGGDPGIARGADDLLSLTIGGQACGQRVLSGTAA